MRTLKNHALGTCGGGLVLCIAMLFSPASVAITQAKTEAGVNPAKAASTTPQRHYLAKTGARGSGRVLRARRVLRAETNRANRPKRHRSPSPQAPSPAPIPLPPPAKAPVPGPSPAPTPTLTPGPTPGPDPTTTQAPILEAAFENNLTGWSIGGVGEAMPTVVSDIVRSGSRSAKVALSGTQTRSELILGGNGSASISQMVKFSEGSEYWYGFSFYIVSMVYGHPGAHNLIMQLKGNDDGSPPFGLQLWNYDGDHHEYRENPKGLWSHGTGMGGDRFLAPAAEQQWHDVAIHFKASRVGAGFYEVYVDGNLVDSRTGTSILPSTASFAYIKNGLYRNGDKLAGASEIRLDAARLGTSRAAVTTG